MKLSDHVELIRSLIYKAFDNQFARLGVGASKMFDRDKLPVDLHDNRTKIEELIDSHTEEMESYTDAREKALDELTFTLFNRFAAIKVMEAHNLVTPIVIKDAAHGDRSFGHKVWLEENPDMRQEDLEGIREYMKYEFNRLGESIPLFHKDYRYALLPYVIELNEIIDAFNEVAKDPQVEKDIWQSDDILGWLYESYNNVKKKAHKDSGNPTEYHKVSLQSQIYTPRWVVEFLVNNSLGKLYLEMYPDSDIANQYKIANAPQKRIREPKPLQEIKLIDPASGSGNFLLYAFELYYELYLDQIENYGADYDEDDIAQLIIEHNLHGIDLDDRAIQLAQLGLWIKAKQKRRSIGKLNFNVVSTDFFLPDFDFVYPIFKQDISDTKQMETIESIWNDLQDAYKFGSLVQLNEKVEAHISALKESGAKLFSKQEKEDSKVFKERFLINLEQAFLRFATQQGSSFLTDKTKDAITFLRLITQRYDVATANPPYTSRREYGKVLKSFIEKNYKSPYDTYINLYACFIQRIHQLLNDEGKIAMVTPMTFMFISTFESTRKLILSNYQIQFFVQYGFGGMFSESVDPAFYIFDRNNKLDSKTANFIKLDGYFGDDKKERFKSCLNDFIYNKSNKHNFSINQNDLLEIKSSPFIYWISASFRKKFSSTTLEESVKVCQGLATGDNSRFLRYWWELKNDEKSNSKWRSYAKGGTFNKWAGNLWLKVNWENNGSEIKNFKDSNGKLRSRPQNEKYYFLEGITYSASGRGGYAFRQLPKGSIFDVGGSSIFPVKSFKNLKYILALLNSKLAFYIANCLNPTANIQVGDLQRVPFIIPQKKNENYVASLAVENILLTQELLSFDIEESNFVNSPFLVFLNRSDSTRKIMRSYIEFVLYKKSIILVNEHLINVQIFNIYNLTSYDLNLVVEDQGVDSASLPLSSIAAYDFINTQTDDLSNEVVTHLKANISFEKSKDISLPFEKLFNSNKDIGDIAIEYQIHPVEVWYKFKNQEVFPLKFASQKSMEFLTDMLREILMEDEDGIIPLVPNAGEKVLLDRIEEKFIEKGFSMAQYSSFDSLLGREMNDYLNNYFFKALSDHLSLFSYQPKTPFIWHLTSGPEHGFDCYIIIYKWSRDKLYSIRSRYVEQHERSLQNRQTDLRAKSAPTAAEQNELDKIFKQLKEIEAFKEKIDDLLADGYNPILDDGVGKNIAPLQKRKMIPYDVLTKGELKKYLNADW